jgi:hypothetical protein
VVWGEQGVVVSVDIHGPYVSIFVLVGSLILFTRGLGTKEVLPGLSSPGVYIL